MNSGLGLGSSQGLLRNVMRGREDAATKEFYSALRYEVTEGNPLLDPGEQSDLRNHYPVMMQPSLFPPRLVGEIYAARRAPAVEKIASESEPLVFDAGCGFGSESFLFAAAGARVWAVDMSQRQIAIAQKRKQYFEELFERNLAINFVAGDLETVKIARGLSFTWLASVLAAIRDQDVFLGRISDATLPGGAVMVTDMNLLNPLFVLKEWMRRRRFEPPSDGSGVEASFTNMLRRKNRCGARYYQSQTGTVDDVQFFRVGTLHRLLEAAAFVPGCASFSGFLPPRLGRGPLARLEPLLSRVPFVRRFGYFYVVFGRKLLTPEDRGE